MQEQRAPVKQPDLSWQYVILMIAIVVLVVLVSKVPVTIERAPAAAANATPTAVPTPAPTVVAAPLTADSLDAHYEDETGLAFDYPSSWFTGVAQSGAILLTNFPQDVQSLPENWAIVGIQLGTLADLAAPDGTVPEPGTSPHDLLQSLLDSSGLTDLAIQDLTVDSKPAALVHVESASQSSEFDFVIITPNDNEVLTVRGEVTLGSWDELSGLFNAILASMKLDMPSN